MNEVSILKFKIDYYDLQSLALIFLQVNIYSPLLFIAAVYTLKTIFFWTISMFNGNKYWKFIYIFINNVRRRRYWGIIVDEKSHNVVSFAKVKLIKFEKTGERISKKFLSSTISDYKGRYYFNYKGKFENLFIEAKALGYKKFYKEIDTLSHISENSEIVYDVFLTPSNKSFNLRIYLLAINFTANILTIVAASLGLLVSIYHQLTVDNSVSFIMCAVYVYILFIAISNIFRKYTLKKFEVLESLLMKKIPGAVVRLYDKKHQLHLAITNNKGYVLLDWVPGEHQILVTKKGYELIDESTGMKNKKAYLTNNNYIKLKKKFKNSQNITSVNKDIKIKTSLKNPFSEIK